MNQYEPLVIPSGKAAGCLPRASRVGQLCSRLEDSIEVIDPDEWGDFIGEIDLREHVDDILDQDGVGCHDDKTEVLTDKGWRFWSEYDGKSQIGTVNQFTHELEFQRPSKFTAFDYDGELLCTNHRSMSFALTPNHRMFVRGWDQKNKKLKDTYEFRTIQNVGWYAGMMASPKGYCGTEVRKVRVGNHEYEGDDFIALVSLVTSDGWAGGTDSTKSRVSFCCFRDDRIEMVRSLADRVGFREETSRPGVWVQSNNELAEWFRTNAYTSDKLTSIHKRVPDFIKVVCQRQVELFLDFYGDQHIAENGRRAFYTSSRQMSDDIQELLLRIGKRGGICKHKPRDATFSDGRKILKDNVNKSYTITEWTTDNCSIERKKLESDRYKGIVYCATVPNSTLVTRRKGQVLISGNSCATESATQATMICRSLEGLPHVLLNPWSMYCFTSGGRDGGSNIDTNLDHMRTVGILPMDIWPRSKGWRTKPSDDLLEKEASKYRIHEFYDCTTTAEIGTALIRGMPVVFGWSGHSCVLTSIKSRTEAAYCNSWAKSWGDEGFGTVRLSSINFGYGAFAVRTVVDG